MFNLIQKFLVFGLALLIVGCSTLGRKPNFDLHSDNEVKEDYAIVYIYRNEDDFTFLTSDIKINNLDVVNLKDNEFTKIYVKPKITYRKLIKKNLENQAESKISRLRVSIISSKWHTKTNIDSDINMLFYPKNVYYIKLKEVIAVAPYPLRYSIEMSTNFETVFPIMADKELRKCCVYKKPIVEYYDLNK